MAARSRFCYREAIGIDKTGDYFWILFCNWTNIQWNLDEEVKQVVLVKNVFYYWQKVFVDGYIWHFWFLRNRTKQRTQQFETKTLYNLKTFRQYFEKKTNLACIWRQKRVWKPNKKNNRYIWHSRFSELSDSMKKIIDFNDEYDHKTEKLSFCAWDINKRT